MGKRVSLGSDEITAAKIAAITIFLSLIVLFGFFAANGTPQAKELANFYLIVVALPALLWVVIDLAIVKRSDRSASGHVDIPDSVTYERESPVFGKDIGRKGKAALFLAAMLLGTYVLLTTSQQSTLSLVQAPTFQSVDPGPYGSAALSGLAGIFENWLFFGAIMPTVFALSYLGARKTFWLAVVITLFLTPLIFSVYHFARYSESPKALDSVYVFGFVCTGSTMLTGSLILCDAWHFSNNFGVTFFATTPGDLLGPLAIVWLLSLLGTAAYMRRG